ncbi:MAG: 16S rRNA (cytidine(1402)-2'-O)-methyltransferase [Clostridia bacterium]|nr:16S rRNA (cytidine(1402)-2'-O)-methyltransferase [Clostridia bacterium]
MPNGTLYLVATPIGNLSDITLRALETLKSVSLIAAEDTRVTRKLLTHFEITTPTFSYHEHNKREAGPTLVERLLSGEDVALVTDAGTPAISDPGEDLVRLCAESEIPVVPIPGACAAVCALIVSGLDTRRFVFEGFLPAEKKEREERLFALKNETRTAILYESPHHLLATLEALFSALGDRRITLCRELTKLNETTLRTTLSCAVAHFSENAPRGEFVLVLEGAKETETPFWEELTVDEHFESYLKQGYSKKDAIRAVAADRGVKKNEIYMHFVEKDG